jgi:hypothetical protein
MGEGRRKVLHSNIPISLIHVPLFSCLFHSLHSLQIWPFSGTALVTLLLISTDSLRALVQAHIWTGFNTHGSDCLQLGGACLLYFPSLKMKAGCYSETSVIFYWTTWYHIPEDSPLLFLQFLFDPLRHTFISCDSEHVSILYTHLFILSCVRGSVMNNNGFWIGRLDLLAMLVQLHLITITHNSSQSVTA